MKTIIVCLSLFAISFEALSFNKVSLTDPMAQCLDGTLGAYYVAPGDPNKILISFEGGGWCGEPSLQSTYESCYQRSKTNLGSSAKYPASAVISSDGVLSDNPQNYFLGWTKVHLKYCDGSGHQGTKSNPIAYKGVNMYFRGNNITVAQLNSIDSKFGLFNTMTHIVVTGQSAGGLATYLWTNYIADRAAKTTKVWSLPDSGIFLDSVNIQTNESSYRAGFESILKIANVEMDPPTKQCVAANRNALYKCMFAEYLHRYIKVPQFAIQSLYDSWSLYNIIGMRCQSGSTLTNCNTTERAYIQQYHQNTIRVLLATGQDNRNGYWAPACVNHVYSTWQALYSKAYRIPANSENSLNKGIADWISGVEESSRHIDFGEWPINQPCSGI